ncbi:MAG: hypothetical protein ACLPUO_08175 [Streptosporangiaceae bacterium]
MTANGSAAEHATAASETSPRGRRLSPGQMLARLPVLARKHWIAALLLTAGLVLRILAMVAYRPALLYVDTLKYLYHAWAGSDPVGYKVPLKIILAVGNLTTVVGVQHLLGLAMAVALYAVLIRRGTARWLAALAIAPVLLDAYQLQMEQTIMPDVWFEALIVAGLVVLAWRPELTTGAVVLGGVILGASATIRQVGEILIVPAVIFVAVAAGGWRPAIRKCLALCVAFAVPILFYCAASYDLSGQFSLSRSGVAATYGRMAAAADCATLKPPAGLASLCPSAGEQTVGPDRLDHDANSPVKLFTPPAGMSRNVATGKFDDAVLKQQPLRVAEAIGRDALKLFAVVRVTSPGDTPISRWQFQKTYPSYQDITVGHAGVVILGLKQVGGPILYTPLNPAYGGRVGVNKPIAAFLRSYQLDGGYTPGPILLLAALLGLAGSVLGLVRRRASAADRQLTLACLLFWVAGVADLLMSDLFEFSWRYQLPATVTLIPAGALGAAALFRYGRARWGRQSAADSRDEKPQLAPSAG